MIEAESSFNILYLMICVFSTLKLEDTLVLISLRLKFEIQENWSENDYYEFCRLKELRVLGFASHDLCILYLLVD